MSTIYEDKSINYVARQDWAGNTPFTMTKYRVKGMTLEHVRQWYDEPYSLRVLNSKTLVTQLEDEGEYKMMHMLVGCPFPL